MYQDQLKYIIRHQFRELGKYIKKIMQDFDVEDIHQFRVEYKKLRAFVRMLSQHQEVDKAIKISKKLRKCYKILGAIRDLQLQQLQILESTKKDIAKPAEYLQFLLNEIEKWETLLFKIYSKETIAECKNKTSAFIPYRFPLAGFSNFKKEKWSTVNAIIQSRDFSDDNLHSIRKNLKDLFYNLKLYEEVEKRNLSIGIRKGQNASWFNKLLDDLGSHQDKRIAIGLLKPGVINNLDSGSREQMERIKKTWTKEKAHLKKLLVTQLETEIVPLRVRSSGNKLPDIR